MSLKEQITQDLKAAMKARDTVRLDVVRALRGAILHLEKSGKGEATDEYILQSVKTQIKERRELIEAAQKASRNDIIEDEEQRVTVLQSYLPPALTSEELAAIVEKAVISIGAEDIKAMGKVMGVAKQAVQASGKDVDNRELSELIKKRLS